MSLPTTPPRYSSLQAALAPVEYRERGWRVFSVEKGIGFRRSNPELLGVFNTALKNAVKRFQAGHGLIVDGIVGPSTWLPIGAEACNAADRKYGLDHGTCLGFWVFEGAGVGAATNWQSPGGVDCGAAGLRVYGPPYAMEDPDDGYGMLDAFNPKKAMLLAAERFQNELLGILEMRPGFERGERHKRIAALGHNAPFLRNQILRNHPPKGAEFPRDYLDTPEAEASWTENPSTGEPYSHVEWAIEYPRRILSFTALNED